MRVLDIYTDASIIKKLIGVGVVMIDGECEYRIYYKTNARGIRREMLQINGLSINDDSQSHGESNKDTNMAEAYAVLIALQEIPEGVIYDMINIYTDSLTVFDIIHNLSKSRKKTTKRILSICNESITKQPIDIRWIKGHAGVYGNSIANTLSRLAAKTNGDLYQYNKQWWKDKMIKYNEKLW